MLFLDFLFLWGKYSAQGKFHSERTIETKLNCKTTGRDSTISGNYIDIYMHDLATVVQEWQIRRTEKMSQLTGVVVSHCASSLSKLKNIFLVLITLTSGPLGHFPRKVRV